MDFSGPHSQGGDFLSKGTGRELKMALGWVSEADPGFDLQSTEAELDA